MNFYKICIYNILCLIVAGITPRGSSFRSRLKDFRIRSQNTAPIDIDWNITKKPSGLIFAVDWILPGTGIVGCFVYDELRVPEDGCADAKEQLKVYLLITVASHV